jgi:hypothetical protein
MSGSDMRIDSSRPDPEHGDFPAATGHFSWQPSG